MDGTYRLPRFYRGGRAQCSIRPYFASISFLNPLISNRHDLFIFISVIKVKKVHIRFYGLCFGLSYPPSPPPLSPLLSSPVVRRGQVNGGTYDDRWPLQAEGLSVNTKQLVCPAHLDVGVHIHSCWLLDSSFLNTQARNDAPQTSEVTAEQQQQDRPD